MKVLGKCRQKDREDNSAKAGVFKYINFHTRLLLSASSFLEFETRLVMANQLHFLPRSWKGVAVILCWSSRESLEEHLPGNAVLPACISQCRISIPKLR